MEAYPTARAESSGVMTVALLRAPAVLVTSAPHKQSAALGCMADQICTSSDFNLSIVWSASSGLAPNLSRCYR